MTDQPPARPFYLRTDAEPVFGLLHPARPDIRSGTGVLIVGPWGWDDVATYRSRREWAERLAGLGHEALRIDLPGAGDSGNSASDAQRVEAWTAAVIAAARSLRDLEGCGRVAVIGMGLGGLIAGQAICEGGPIDDLVLWAAPATGRAFLREARAFAGLQTSRFTGPSLLPDGWMEVGGFVLTAETIEALGSLALAAIPGGVLRRALLLERDGAPVDDSLRLHLQREGVSVEVAPGDGWESMCFDIEKYQPPVEVFSTVAGWLASSPMESPAVAPPSPMDRDDCEMAVGSARIRESALTLDQPFGRMFGVTSEPLVATQSGLCVVFLNAGAVRRIGPNRMWVDAARRWAARGLPSLRVDAEGIGDADGDPREYANVGAFYKPARGAQVVAALDALEERGLGHRFVLIGLCSGAYWAFRVALADDRIVGAVLLNPRALIWDTRLSTRRKARLARNVLRRESWRRFLRGEIRLRRIASVARAFGAHAVREALVAPARRLRSREQSNPETLEASFDRLHRRGTTVALAFSDDELLATELHESGLPERFSRWPNASFVQLPGRDHTVRPIVAQLAAHELIDRVLAQELDRSAERARGVPERVPR